MKNKTKLMLGAAVISALSSCSQVDTGTTGVQTRFGKIISEQPLEPGLHYKGLFSSVSKISIRTQHVEEQAIIPTKEMLNMQLDVSVNYHIDKNKVLDIYKNLGEDYFKKYLYPHIKSSIREVSSGYSSNDFFSSKRNDISKKIEESLKLRVKDRGFIIEEVMLKNISAPASIQKAIEEKQSQQQQAQAMKFKLQREELEAKRKKIEAKGIQQFQEIVKQGIDKNLLAWKGIEATEALAKSNNAKIIIIGNSKSSGLPLIIPTT